MGNDKQVAIYHPYIDITDGALINTAALYWDELRTIVPESISDPYQSPASREARKEGFLCPRVVHETDDAVRRAGEEFQCDIEKEGVREHIVSIARKTRQKKWTELHFQKWAPLSLMAVWVAFHDDLPFSPTDHDSIIFPSPIADSYMTRLVSAIAEKDGAAPITDSVQYHDVLVDRHLDYDAPSKEIETHLAKLSLQAISIHPNVPLVRILRFRDKHREELVRFRQAIRKVARGISAADPNRYQELIKQTVEDEVLPSREQIERRLRENKVQFDLSVMNAALPTVLAVVGSSGSPWYAVGGGLVSLCVVFAHSVLQGRSMIKNDPFGYLYQLGKHFG